MKIGTIISLCSIIIFAHGFLNEPKWISHLVKYINGDLKVSQTVIIIDDKIDTETINIESILRKVQSNITSQVINLKNDTFSKAGILKQEKLSQDLQSTTLFIVILFVKDNVQNSSFSKSTQFLIELTAHQIRPKCLTIMFSQKEGLNFKELLEKMWSKKFLDFTILEVIYKRSENKSSLWNRLGNIAMVHYLNPFTGIYSTTKYKSKLTLFPNKLRDLNGFEMKVGSFNYPPYVELKRNSSGHPTSVTGPDVLVVKALSKTMNFKIAEVPSQKEWWGRWECSNASLFTGFAQQIRDSKIRFLTNQAPISYNCSMEPSRTTGTIRYSALILKLKEKEGRLLLSMKWLYLVLLIVPIWLMTHLLKFNTYYWSLIHIMQAMLGFTVPREPQRSAERIVFATLLIAFSVFSSTLVALLTDIKIVKNSEVIINTLEDLNKSNLVPTMSSILYKILTRESDHFMESLLNKSSIGIKQEKCLKMLLDHKNVACIDRESTAEKVIPMYLDADGRPRIKIIKQTFGQYDKGMIFEKNSPFVRGTDTILIKLLESGINNHWQQSQSFLSSLLRKPEELIMEEEKKSAKLIIPLLIVLATGYGLSILVFVIELLSKYF